MKVLLLEIQVLKDELAKSKAEVKKVKNENSLLKQAVNICVSKLDGMEQYGRRENIRIHGVPESTGNRDDGEMVVLEIAKKLNVNLESGDIQRAHRLGWHKKTMRKPRPIIAKFISYKKRNEICSLNQNLKNLKITRLALSLKT